jgi:hypothetical protein
VDGRPHDGALDHSSLGERAIERGRLELAEPRPQSDVRRRRFLRLQSADPLDGLDDAGIRRLEQLLAGERRPAQPARADDLGGGGPAHSRGSCPARNVAMSSV